MKDSCILHIITRLDMGGSATNTLRTVAHLGAERAVLIAGKTSDPDGAIKAFIDEHSINCLMMPYLVREINLLKDVYVFWKLYRFLKNNKFDIVHTHSSKAGIVGRWAAWCAGVKIIIHTPHGHVFDGYFGPLATRLFIFLERLTSKITTKIITLTSKGKEEHVQWKIAPSEKFVVIPSGICIDEFSQTSDAREIKAELGISPHMLVVGTVSRLDPIKGNRCFIKAIQHMYAHNMKLLENVRFLFVGDGSEAGELRQLVHEYHLDDHVIFVGARKDVTRMYAAIDIFVLASRMEGMGRVLLEAMVQGKPIVATRVGGIPDIVLDGITGLLVSAEDHVELAEAIMSLVKDTQRAHQMGIEGKKRMIPQDGTASPFSIEGMLEKIDTLYEEELKVVT